MENTQTCTASTGKAAGTPGIKVKTSEVAYQLFIKNIFLRGEGLIQNIPKRYASVPLLKTNVGKMWETLKNRLENSKRKTLENVEISRV